MSLSDIYDELKEVQRGMRRLLKKQHVSQTTFKAELKVLEDRMALAMFQLNDHLK